MAGQTPTGRPGRPAPAHPIRASAGCRSARCGPRTSGTCTARPTRHGGGNWAAPIDADYLTHCLLRGRARIDFRGLAPQLALELQYAVQCRHDQATIITAAPPVVTWAIRTATDAGVASLLDCTAQQWRELAGSKTGPLSAVPGLRPRRRGDPARRHRLGGRVPPRRVAAARLPGLTRSPASARSPATICGSTASPSPGYGHWPSAGPGCG